MDWIDMIGISAFMLGDVLSVCGLMLVFIWVHHGGIKYFWDHAFGGSGIVKFLSACIVVNSFFIGWSLMGKYLHRGDREAADYPKPMMACSDILVLHAGESCYIAGCSAK